MTNTKTNTITTSDVGSNEKEATVEAIVKRLYNDCVEEAKAFIAEIASRLQTKQNMEEHKQSNT